jgi:tetratricopeptide (TPR) repeat protein
MLAHTFRQLEQHEKAVEYYVKALSINKEQKGEGMQKNRDQKSIINEWCGYCCRFIAGKQEEAIRSYERAKEIAKQDGGKYQEYRANQAIGNILWKTDHFKAKNYYQQALENAKELSDKYCEGTSYLGLAAVGIKEYDYEMARKWYEKALVIFESKHIDHILKGKALAGLGIVWFNLGNDRKSIELFQKARKSANEKTDKGIFLATNVKMLIYYTSKPFAILIVSEAGA